MTASFGRNKTRGGGKPVFFKGEGGGKRIGLDRGQFHPRRLARACRLGRRQTDALRMISISGDSMVPLLEHDDTVMLDYSQTRPSPPGIFILDDGVGLVAKRIEIIPSTTPQMLRISSENSAYSSYQRRIDEVHIIGRVVWFARRL